jgi:hypothetical protein
MAKYRITSEHGAYLPTSTEKTLLELGESSSAGARAYGVRAVPHQLFKQGDVVDMADSFVPGPHLEPLDEPARDAMAAYEKKHPLSSLDPTRSLPLGRDPMMPLTFEQRMMAQMEGMMAEAQSRPPTTPSDPKLDALLEAVTALVKLNTAAPAARKGA